jgi:hypothetical protein
VPIFRINSSGSFFSCSSSNDGRTVVTGGKAVHARQFGSGGLLYNVEVDTSEVPTSISHSGYELPDHLVLEQNYPNPFNPETSIRFEIPEGTSFDLVSLRLYGIDGKEIADLLEEFDYKKLGANYYEVRFDGSNLQSGVYFYKLRAGGFSITKKAILLK